MTILGYDMYNQPLRAGDRVVIVRVRNPEFIDMIGETISITGINEEDGALITNVPARRACAGVTVQGRHVRKLPPKQADNEVTTWESIEQLTGWAPEGVQQ